MPHVSPARPLPRSWMPTRPPAAVVTFRRIKMHGNAKSIVANVGFDPTTSGLWAQHASPAPICFGFGSNNLVEQAFRITIESHAKLWHELCCQLMPESGYLTSSHTLLIPVETTNAAEAAQNASAHADRCLSLRQWRLPLPRCLRRHRRRRRRHRRLRRRHRRPRGWSSELSLS